MLYAYHGTDTEKIADQVNRLVTQLRTKRPDVEVFVFEGSSVQEVDLDALKQAQGLFVQKNIIVLRETLVAAESRELVLSRMKEISQSENIFIIAEGKLNAEQKRAISKHAEKVEEHTSNTKKQEFNAFELGDLLGARDRQGLWTKYQLALSVGMEPEVLYGTIQWALRGMVAASNTSTANEAGMSQFPYSKAKRSLQSYTEQELQKLSHSLMEAYHEARRGGLELRLALERWILSI